MKKFLTVLMVVAVLFTFSFGSAFAASTVTNQTGTYVQNNVKDELLNDTAFVAKTGAYGITEAYRYDLVEDWKKVAGDYGTLVGAPTTQATNGYKINSTNYYTAEKAEAKELVNAAIETFKAATTAADAKAAEDKLVLKLNKLVKSAIDTTMGATAASYMDTVDVAIGSVLSTSTKTYYFLPEYGYIKAANLDVANKTVSALDDTAVAVSKAASDESVSTEEDLVEYWFIDNGYRTLADAKAHVAEFKAALVPLTTTEIAKIQAEYDAIDAKCKAAAAAFTSGSGYGVSSVDGVDLDALEAIYAEQKAYEKKYCVVGGSLAAIGGANLFKTWTSFKSGTYNTEGYLVYAYENQYAAEIKAVDLTNEDAVVALVDKIDALQYVYDNITISTPAASKEYTALTKAYNDFKKAADDALTAAGNFEWISGSNTAAYFDASEKNVKALEANRAAYDKLVKTYGSSNYNDALEAKILAGEHNKAAAAGYDEEAEKIDTSKVQALLNNATVKVTTKALGNKKVRVQATIDTESFRNILNAMDDGCTVEYQFYYKKAANTTYKAGKVKDVNYTTFKLAKGVKYNFQCKVVFKDADGNVVATKDYKGSTVGTRTVK